MVAALATRLGHDAVDLGSEAGSESASEFHPKGSIRDSTRRVNHCSPPLLSAGLKFACREESSLELIEGILPFSHLTGSPCTPLNVLCTAQGCGTKRIDLEVDCGKLRVCREPTYVFHLLLTDRVPRLGLNGLCVLLKLDGQEGDAEHYRDIGRVPVTCPVPTMTWSNCFMVSRLMGIFLLLFSCTSCTMNTNGTYGSPATVSKSLGGSCRSPLT